MNWKKFGNRCKILNRIIVISGASGSGKTTLCRMLADRLGFHYGVSHTTRPKRGNEVEGKDYYFVDTKIFDQMVADDQFLEWALVYGNKYGTSKKMVSDSQKAGQGVVLDVDTQGALAIQAKCPEAFLIFLKAPSHEVLKERLIQRGTDSSASLENRLKQAYYEENLQDRYDAVVVNEDLNQTYQALENLIKNRLK